MLKKTNRLSRKSDFQKLYRQGHKQVTPFFVIRYYPNYLPFTRFGIVVSSKVSKKAYQRNLLKRRITEILRERTKQIKEGQDCVLVCLKRCLEQDYQSLVVAVEQIFNKAQLLLK
jgi:ribonuclease P protein component